MSKSSPVDMPVVRDPPVKSTPSNYDRDIDKMELLLEQYHEELKLELDRLHLRATSTPWHLGKLKDSEPDQVLLELATQKDYFRCSGWLNSVRKAADGKCVNRLLPIHDARFKAAMNPDVFMEAWEDVRSAFESTMQMLLRSPEEVNALLHDKKLRKKEQTSWKSRRFKVVRDNVETLRKLNGLLDKLEVAMPFRGEKVELSLPELEAGSVADNYLEEWTRPVGHQHQLPISGGNRLGSPSSNSTAVTLNNARLFSGPPTTAARTVSFELPSNIPSGAPRQLHKPVTSTEKTRLYPVQASLTSIFEVEPRAQSASSSSSPQWQPHSDGGSLLQQGSPSSAGQQSQSPSPLLEAVQEGGLCELEGQQLATTDFAVKSINLQTTQRRKLEILHNHCILVMYSIQIHMAEQGVLDESINSLKLWGMGMFDEPCPLDGLCEKLEKDGGEDFLREVIVGCFVDIINLEEMLIAYLLDNTPPEEESPSSRVARLTRLWDDAIAILGAENLEDIAIERGTPELFGSTPEEFQKNIIQSLELAISDLFGIIPAIRAARHEWFLEVEELQKVASQSESAPVEEKQKASAVLELNPHAFGDDQVRDATENLAGDYMDDRLEPSTFLREEVPRPQDGARVVEPEPADSPNSSTSTAKADIISNFDLEPLGLQQSNSTKKLQPDQQTFEHKAYKNVHSFQSESTTSVLSNLAPSEMSDYQSDERDFATVAAYNKASNSKPKKVTNFPVMKTRFKKKDIETGHNSKECAIGEDSEETVGFDEEVPVEDIDMEKGSKIGRMTKESTNAPGEGRLN